ncbi:hypothetical protein DPEC_G00347110 [Dallia pectoralis]|uniref:Uncharacterized protein n=1 Tax=Dallia pectoralis TaxID=75939 RepID=A0ACC2F3Y5_DALPE|nr:hypothetical protein DPEC_G00347110 [Dallia pectoralis]
MASGNFQQEYNQICHSDIDEHSSPSSLTRSLQKNRQEHVAPALSRDSGVSSIEHHQVLDINEMWSGCGAEDSTVDKNIFSEEELLDITFEACNTTGTDEVQASTIIQYLQTMTGQSLEQDRLNALHRMLDPEGLDPAMSRTMFRSTMTEWIAQCCQDGMHEDSRHTSVTDSCKVSINGRDLSGPEIKTNFLEEEQCHCDTRELQVRVAELKHALCRMSKQNSSLWMTVSQCEDTNLQLTAEITELGAQLDSAQHSVGRSRSLMEELEEAREAVRDAQERASRVQASSCRLNRQLLLDRTCSEDYLNTLRKVNAEMREELEETIVTLAVRDRELAEQCGDLEERTGPICRVPMPTTHRDGIQNIIHRIQSAWLEHLLHTERDYIGCAVETYGSQYPLIQPTQTGVKQQPVNVYTEEKMAEKRRLLEQQDQKKNPQAKKAAVVKWWKGFKVDGSRTMASTEDSQTQPSQAPIQTGVKLQHLEGTITQVRGQMHHIEATLRTAQEEVIERQNTQDRIAVLNEDKKTNTEEPGGSGKVSAQPVSTEILMVTLGKMETMVGGALEAESLVRESYRMVSQVKERMARCTQMVEEVLTRAAVTDSLPSALETRVAAEPQFHYPTEQTPLPDVNGTARDRTTKLSTSEPVKEVRNQYQCPVKSGNVLGRFCVELLSIGGGSPLGGEQICDDPKTPSTDDHIPSQVPNPKPNGTSWSGHATVFLGGIAPRSLVQNKSKTAPGFDCPAPTRCEENVAGSDDPSSLNYHRKASETGDCGGTNALKPTIGRDLKHCGSFHSEELSSDVNCGTKKKGVRHQLYRFPWVQTQQPFEDSSTRTNPSEGPFVSPRTRQRPAHSPVMPVLPEEDEDSPEEIDSSSSSPSTCTPLESRAVTMTMPAPTIVFPKQATVIVGQRDSNPLEQTRPHSPRPRLSRISVGGSITAVDSTGNVIDLVKDPLPELLLSEEDRKKNLELLEEAKKVSDRFLTRRGRKSTCSLSESPTGLSPNLTPSSSPVPSRSSSLTTAPQIPVATELNHTPSSPVSLRLEVPSVREQTSAQDQSPRRLVDWKPNEKRKVSSGTLSPRHIDPPPPREASGGQKENCDPRVGAKKSPVEGPVKAPNQAPATGVAKPVPRPQTQQAPCTAEIKTMGAFPPLMRAVSWDTVGTLNTRNEAPSSLPTSEETFSFQDKTRDVLLKSSGYKDFPVQPVGVQKLSKIREEHKLMRNQSVAGSMLPDLSETAEQERGPSPLPSPGFPTDEEAKEKSDAMPNISDIMLRKLRLHRGLPGCAPPLTEKEVENAFVQLSLAFRNDNYTLETRLKQAERERTLTEENTEKELEEFKNSLKCTAPQWSNMEQRESYQRLIETVAVLHRLATRLSSRAEMVGAVRQEKRMNKATEVMMQYVENLKRTYEKDHAELMEFKKLANQNSNRCYGGSIDNGDDGVPRPSRSMSLTLGKALPRRRVSVAVVPKFNLLNVPGQTMVMAGPGPTVAMGPSPQIAMGPALPVLCEGNGVKGNLSAEPANPVITESVAEQEAEQSAPARTPFNLEEIRSEIKAQIEEEAYQKGYVEAMKKNKEIKEVKDEEKGEVKPLDLAKKEEEKEIARKEKTSSKVEEALVVLDWLWLKIFRRHRLWVVLALVLVTFLAVNVFTYFNDRYNSHGDMSAERSLVQGKKKMFGLNTLRGTLVTPLFCLRRLLTMILAWILTLLPGLSLTITDLHFESSKFHTFPKNQNAGVFQVQYKNDLNKFTYAFNATKAKEVCSFLGVTMASNAQVEEAQKQGLETCKFGWVEEHFVVIPRILPNVNCGQNKTGVIIWRTAVTELFDVFCFNVSAIQLEDTITDSPLATQKTFSVAPSSSFTSIATTISHLARSTQSAEHTSPKNFSQVNILNTPSTSINHTSDNPETRHPPKSNGRSSIGAVTTALLISFALILLLTATGILCYFRKNNRLKTIISCLDRKQKRGNIETEDWTQTCLKETKETQNEAGTEPEDEVCKEIGEDVSVNIGDETDTQKTPEIEP